MPKKISVALHIGAHKTASSHLQKTFVSNADLLADAKIRVYGPGYLRRPGRSIGAMFGLGDNAKHPRRSPAEQLDFLAKDARRVVLSEENFAGALHSGNGKIDLPLYSKADQKLAALTDAIAPQKLQLFISIRNPTDFMTSAYGQVLMSGRVLPFRDFSRKNRLEKVDWAELIERLRAVSGVEQVYVWLYEDYKDVAKLVCRRMLRWHVGGRIVPYKSMVHQGLSVRAVQQTLIWHSDGREGPLALEARKRHPITDTNPTFRPYGAVATRRAQLAYADQIEQISSMENVTLLRPPVKNEPEA